MDESFKLLILDAGMQAMVLMDGASKLIILDIGM